MPNAVLAHNPSACRCGGAEGQGQGVARLEGMDLCRASPRRSASNWDETEWAWNAGYGQQAAPKFHVVAIDYGVKRNILRLLATAGCKVTVVPATTTAAEVMALAPDGVFLSNGPGDPAATGAYAVPVIRELIAQEIPTFGICLGHQMIGLAVGGRTNKMHSGPSRGEPPVKDYHRKGGDHLMNHGFAVDRDSLPANAQETHRPLFDGSKRRISRWPTSRCSRCSTTPRPAPARATATICSSASWI